MFDHKFHAAMIYADENFINCLHRYNKCMQKHNPSD